MEALEFREPLGESFFGSSGYPELFSYLSCDLITTAFTVEEVPPRSRR